MGESAPKKASVKIPRHQMPTQDPKLRIRNFDEVIGELVAFWKESSKVLKEVEL